LHCKAARYNTILSATRPDGHIIRTVSAGALGFKGVNRRSYEAAYQCAMATFKALERAMEVEAEPRWQLYLKGFGQGRDAVQKAVLSAEGEMLRRKLVKVVDRTPIKIGGTRAMKQKR
ncbi:translational machinery component, partial [Daedalea quercina L-15889]